MADLTAVSANVSSPGSTGDSAHSPAGTAAAASRLWCVVLGRCLVLAAQQLPSVCEGMAAAEDGGSPSRRHCCDDVEQSRGSISNTDRANHSNATKKSVELVDRLLLSRLRGRHCVSPAAAVVNSVGAACTS